MIKFGKIRFFQDDYENKDNPGLMRDFLALTENKFENARVCFRHLKCPHQKEDALAARRPWDGFPIRPRFAVVSVRLLITLSTPCRGCRGSACG
jgi:hypothetical protein